MNAPIRPPRDPLYFLPAASKTAAEIRAFDWQNNPLGPPDEWSPSLKTAVGMMLASDFPKAIVWGPALITLHNDAFRPILGHKPSAIGRSFADVWAEAWDDIRDMAERAFAGQSTYIENFPLTIDRHGFPEQAYFTFCYSPIHDIDGTVAGMMDTVIETTQAVQARLAMETVNGELAHRMRNMITVASAVADQSLRSAPGIPEARDALRRRFAAISNAQTVLTGNDGAEARVGDLVAQIFAQQAMRAEALAADGPVVVLQSRQVLALSLALNELMTNALKYGALSTEAGRIAVSWTLEPLERGHCFRFDWVEQGGPPVSAPTRIGLGSRLIARSLTDVLGGDTAVEYNPEGFRYHVRAPHPGTPMAHVTPG
jgi:two-component sensor histidine kinase